MEKYSFEQYLFKGKIWNVFLLSIFILYRINLLYAIFGKNISFSLIGQLMKKTCICLISYLLGYFAFLIEYLFWKIHKLGRFICRLCWNLDVREGSPSCWYSSITSKIGWKSKVWGYEPCFKLQNST
jgi:hypothetical protein